MPFVGFHAIVVYGLRMQFYQNLSEIVHVELTCHYGWEGDGYQEMVIPMPSYLEQGSIYSLYNESEHICKGYFLNERGTILMCGCGKVLFSV